MKPLFLGTTARRIYGVYHPAARGSRHAVLLCYPGVQEYNSAHWAFRRLASMLARDGHHVLRFDYFGTGDSFGESSDGDPATWVEDIRTAAQELKDQSGARDVSLVGMRLGATLATLASAQDLRARSLILWEPVIDGHDYVKELELADMRRNLMLLHADRTRGRRDELLGHPFPERVRQATQALDLRRGPIPNADKVAIFAAQPRSEHRALQAWFERGGIVTQVREVAEPSTNAQQEVRERALLSNTVLLDITRELKGQLAA